MRQEPEHFEGQDLELLYIARKLKEALAVEELLTARGIDYAVQPEEYFGGMVFQRVRIGAFFYVPRSMSASACVVLEENGYRPRTTKD